MFNPDRFITDRLRAIDASGIRRVFDLAASLKDPVNLSIGQPDFDVPESIKRAAIEAIEAGHNRYTQTQGIAKLIDAVRSRLAHEFPHWRGRDDSGVLITSGVSGGLVLALLTCVGPGDEVIIPDPYFVMYRHLVTLAGATPVYVDTYPDFQLTAARLEQAITPRTKLLLFNSPGNPTGVVAPPEVCRQIAQLCESRGILLLSDEIYDEFCYEKVDGRCPSPAAYTSNLLLLRGYSKTYAMTGWRLGYAAGPRAIIEQMTKLQQYSFVCAPSMTQAAGVLAMDVDMTGHVEAYRRKRDRVVERLAPHYELTAPGGAFYAFPKVPAHLKLTGQQFVEQAIAHSLLIIPGNVFSGRDTHFRISYACNDQMLERGLDILVKMATS
jgi:aminotransferase